MRVRPSSRVAVLAAVSSAGEIGGAERFFEGVRVALDAVGVEATIVPVFNNETGFENIEETYLRYYDLNLDEFDGVISAKAPAYVVRHRNHVCYLMHTMRSFYDMFDYSFPVATDELRRQRRMVQAWDRAALQPPRTRRLLAVGQEVSDRLERHCGLKAEVVRHPSTLQGLRTAAPRDYVFMPGRLHKWKRVELAIRAMASVRSSIRLLISGEGEHGDALRALAADTPQVEFLGRVSDERLAELYAEAIAVVFTPQREDLGMVTLEAFQSGKPVITCVDSGEPARLVEHEASGFVCPPDPVSIAERIDQLAGDPDLAAKLGARGRQSIATITWERVSRALVGALDLRLDVERSA